MEIGTLVKQYQQGDTDAFAQVYVESCQPLFVYAKYLEKDNDKAEDLLQDTYIEIMKSVDSLQHPEAFMTWSKTIMSRLYKRQFSGKGSLESTIKDEEQAASLFDQVEDTDQTFMPAENLDEKALKEFVLEQVNDLPDQQRLAMFSFYYDKLPIREIAGIMDVSENTVKAHLYQGRAAVKQKIEAYEEKHGIRMHSILPTPFLYELFKGIGDATANSLSTDFALKIYQGVAAKVAATGQVLGANAVQAGMEAAGKLGGNAVQSGAQAVQSGQTVGAQAVDAGAKAAIGKTAAGSAAAATTTGTATGVSAKIIALAVAGLLALGGAGFGVHHLLQNRGAANETAGNEQQIDQITAQQEDEKEKERELAAKREATLDAFDAYFANVFEEALEYSQSPDVNEIYYFEDADVDEDTFPDFIAYYVPHPENSYGMCPKACMFHKGKIVDADIDVPLYTDSGSVYYSVKKDKTGFSVLVETFSGNDDKEYYVADYELTDSGLSKGEMRKLDGNVEEVAAIVQEQYFSEDRVVLTKDEAKSFYGPTEATIYLGSLGIDSSTPAVTGASDWKQAYEEYLNNNREWWQEIIVTGHSFYLALEDVNGDSVPELFVLDGYQTVGTDTETCYTFVDGTLKQFPFIKQAGFVGSGGITYDSSVGRVYYTSKPGSSATRAYEVEITDRGYQVMHSAVVDTSAESTVDWGKDIVQDPITVFGRISNTGVRPNYQRISSEEELDVFIEAYL